MSFLSEYGLFLAKTVTVVLAVVATLVAAGVVGSRLARSQRPGRRGLQVHNLNRAYEDRSRSLRAGLVPPKVAKAQAKALVAARKAADQATDKAGDVAGPGTGRPKVFVLDFHGDVRATQVAALREEVSAVVSVARPGDEVVVRLENPGGLIADQGLAAAQLLRVRGRGLRLIVTVDKVAASGGYLMACVADRIVAAPFAVVGSIGVIAEIPNVFRLLERSGIDVEQVTGGEFKRTITPFTQTTPAKRDKLTSQIADTHALFKEFVARHRPQLDVERVGTGEYWYGERALDLGLVDELATSDDYLLARTGEADLFSVSWPQGRSPARRLASLMSLLTDRRPAGLIG